jgi:capsular polysaccharide biosynthesis protein
LRRQQGEQFRVLDPPSLPQRPTFPNRRLFAFGGFAGGLGLGLAIALVLEAQDTTLHTDKDVARLLKLPTLASIPIAVPTNGNGKDHDGKADLRAFKGLVGQKAGD